MKNISSYTTEAVALANAPEVTAAEEMKVRLQDFKSLNRDIDNNIERLERLELRMYSVSSPNLSGMPKAPSSVPDKFAELVGRKDELVGKIKLLIAKRDAERVSLESILAKLRNPDERAVINMRYIDSEEWSDIIEMLFGVREDEDDDYDNYKQRAFRLHSSAIEKMAIVVGGQQ